MATVATMVGVLWRGEPLRSEQVVARFAPTHGRSAVMDKLAQAVDLGLVERTGRGKSTRYHPHDRTDRLDGSVGRQPSPEADT